MADLQTKTGRKRRLWLDFSRRAMLVGALVWMLAEARGQVGPSGGFPAPSGAAPQAAPQGGVSLFPDARTGTAPPSATRPTPPGPNDSIVDVRIVGVKSLPLSKVSASIRTRIGRPYDVELVQEDVRRLDQTRQFIDVKTYWQRVPGGVVVYFDLVERPTLRDVLVIGSDSISKKRLLKEAVVKKGDPADPMTIEEARRKMEAYYREHGYANARVALLEGDKPEDRRVIFYVNEGQKLRVAKVNIVGAMVDSPDRVLTQVSTKRPFLYLFGGEFDRKKLDGDQETLTAYYHSLGYFRARIGRELEFNEKKNWVTVTFVVDEGPRYKIRNVSVLGNKKYGSDVLLADTKVQGGDYFTQAKLIGDTRKLQEHYGGNGYAFADIRPELQYLEDSAQLDVVYNVKEGARYKIGKIDIVIVGDPSHTQEKVVRDRLFFKPGDLFDIRQIRASEVALKRSMLFEVNPREPNALKIAYHPPGTADPDDDLEQGPRRMADRPDQGPGGGPRGGRGGSSGPMFRSQSPDDEVRTLDMRLHPAPDARAVEDGASGAAADSPYGPSRAERSVGAAIDSDALEQSAAAYAGALARRQQPRQPLQPLVPMQYSPGAGQVNPATQALRWGGGAAPAAASASTATTASAGLATQAAPATPAPAYGNDMTPVQGPVRPVDSPQGPYDPGPLGNPNSPFYGGPPEGDLAPLNMRISAAEAMTGRIQIGVGYNTDAGVVGQFMIDEQNFNWVRFPRSWQEIVNGTAWRGAGQRFTLRASPGTQVSNYSISFQEPCMFTTRYSLDLGGYYYDRYFTEYEDRRVGGRVGVGRQFNPAFSISTAFRGANVHIANVVDPYIPDFAIVNNRNMGLYGFSVSTLYDRRDSPFMATEGFVVGASVEQVIGSFQYPRAEVDGRKYFTIYEHPDGTGRHVLSLAAHAGWTGDDTPVYDRFYVGGFSSLRGFEFRGASPHVHSYVTGGDVFVGGNFELLTSIEYLFPVTADDMIHGVFFVDAGTAEPKIDNWSDKFRVAPGFGLRISMPQMGSPAPIALDFAFPVSWQPGDQFQMFSFSMSWLR
jgi:outer membrane protein insertion porin family